MQNFTLYKNYSQISENYQLKLPIDLDVLIPEDDSVRLLSLMMEELDYKKLYEAYSPNGRNPAVPPKIILKILINVKIVMTVLLNQNVQKQRGIKGYKYLLYL